jgi:glycosyltransferase involved in cell wall biosynthesis
MNDVPEKQNVVFGFILFGGTIGGSLIRDARLAAELARRNYQVHIFWAKEKTPLSELDHPLIQHHWLFHGARYVLPLGNIQVFRAINEFLGKVFAAILPYNFRVAYFNKKPGHIDKVINTWIKLTCKGLGNDSPAVKRFANKLEKLEITHVLPSLSLYGAWVLEAQKYTDRTIKYLVTFQGYEVCADYARDMGLEESLYKELYRIVKSSNYPAIAVSDDYKKRIMQDINIEEALLVTIPPGVPPADDTDFNHAFENLKKLMPDLKADVPVLTYFGRLDAEKGLDLLLYAAAILHKRNIDFQLIVAGPSMYGPAYTRACMDISNRLRLPTIWSKNLPVELRSSLYTLSNCIICPSIQREPFGMVAVEAMSHGTPIVVPDIGGIAELVNHGQRQGGLKFNTWDTLNLADRLEQLLSDKELYKKLSQDAPEISKEYSVERLCDRVLDHMSIIEGGSE